MDKPQYQTLKLTEQKHILIVSLNRPEARNAINLQMMSELLQLWQSLFVDAGNARVVILTGEGTAFCAGADLKARANMSLDVWRKQHAVFEQMMLAMLDCPIPMIAAVNGAAFGGGLELALATDFAYAASDAVFSQSEVKIGLIPGALGTQNLPRAAGLRRAKELCFTGAPFSAEEAYQFGVINKVCARTELLPETLKTAALIAENAPIAIRQAKKSLNMAEQLDFKSGFTYEIEAYNGVLNTEDREEGIRAFNEKRKPIFKGK